MVLYFSIFFQINNDLPSFKIRTEVKKRENLICVGRLRSWKLTGRMKKTLKVWKDIKGVSREFSVFPMVHKHGHSQTNGVCSKLVSWLKENTISIFSTRGFYKLLLYLATCLATINSDGSYFYFQLLYLWNLLLIHFTSYNNLSKSGKI